VLQVRSLSVLLPTFFDNLEAAMNIALDGVSERRIASMIRTCTSDAMIELTAKMSDQELVACAARQPAVREAIMTDLYIRFPRNPEEFVT